MGSLDQLYQQVILDHAKERHGRGMREPGADLLMAQSHQLNPLCGDEVTLRVAVEQTGDGDVVRDVAWVGEGCSISQASTSVLYDLVMDRTAVDADDIVGHFRTMIRSRGTVEPDEEVLGDAVAFAGVGRHANRVKCAMLGWTAFEDALHRAIVDAAPRPGATRGSTSDSTSEENR
ncbi:MAG TPA: SUF system NifU family Fe-S cluster assembly protein [Kineosporiaceae bacterium]|nr:SUF system NifU family Fe-S cluster assembly protein [Kineosporiaceae bacterium]